MQRILLVLAGLLLATAASFFAAAQEPETAEAELALDRPARRLIQHGLAREGFDPGAPDGVFGPRTRAAIRAWQAARGELGTGYLDAAQADVLRSVAQRGDAAVGNRPLDALRRAAEQGDVDAQFQLGVAYDLGRGLPENDPEAARWYRLAAERGHPEAQYQVGFIYASGHGAPPDNGEAIRWYRLAAEQGYVHAQFVLGRRYRDGDGVPQNFAEAAHWFRLAAEQGDPSAQANLAKMSAAGGVRQDSAAAATAAPPSPAATAGAAQEIRCDYESGRVCDSAGCAELPTPAGFLVLRHVDDMPLFEDFDIRRCDDRGCTPVTVTRSTSGIFTDLGQRDGTYFVRISHGLPAGPLADLAPSGGGFVEVAPSFLSVYVYHGRCPALVGER